jgi:uncharacterized membrane protein
LRGCTIGRILEKEKWCGLKDNLGFPLWVVLALVSACFTSLRHLYVKRWCNETPPEVLVFVTRLFGALVYLPVLVSSPVSISKPERFWWVLVLTVLVTAGATVFEVQIIQKYSISTSVPYLSFIPVFMIPWTILLLREYPGYFSLAGILITCIGVYLLNSEKRGGGPLLKAVFSGKNSKYMFIISIALGLTTTCDKIAILASSAFTYAIVWTLVSTVVMGLVVLKTSFKSVRQYLFNFHSFFQAVLWAGAFLTQMAGVQSAVGIASGVTYVKMLTMFNIPISVLIGGHYFREGNVWKKFLASLLMFAGAVVVVAAR